jgi:hypothetical protein
MGGLGSGSLQGRQAHIITAAIIGKVQIDRYYSSFEPSINARSLEEPNQVFQDNLFAGISTDYLVTGRVESANSSSETMRW